MAPTLSIAVLLTLVVTITFAYEEVIITEVEETEVDNKKDAFEAPSGKIVTKCTASNCLSRKEFKAYCESVNGQVEGGRCYFSGAIAGLSWSKGWAACKAKNGTMAQIHSSSDANKMRVSLLMAGAVEGQYLALRNQANLPSSKYAIDLDLGFWYESENYFNPRLSARNTYISSRLPESYFIATWDCSITWDQFKYVGGSNSCDENKNGVACMKTTAAQTFELVPNACMSATPIEQVNDISAEECAQACANKASWCRSFNHLKDNVCDLFAWVRTDQPQEQQKTVSDGSCQHYTYVK